MGMQVNLYKIYLLKSFCFFFNETYYLQKEESKKTKLQKENLLNIELSVSNFSKV